MPLSKVSAMELAFERLSKLPKPFSTAELIAEGERLHLSSQKEAKHVSSFDGKASRENRPSSDKLSVQHIVRRIITEDVVEFMGFSYWDSLASTKERMLATDLYNRIREQLRKGATL